LRPGTGLPLKKMRGNDYVKECKTSIPEGFYLPYYRSPTEAGSLTQFVLKALLTQEYTFDTKSIFFTQEMNRIVYSTEHFWTRAALFTHETIFLKGPELITQGSVF